MFHLLHDGRLLQEVLERHRVLLERLDGHRHVVALPHRLVDVAVLAPSQLLFHGDVGPLDLPLVRLRAQGEHFGLVPLGRWIEKLRDQTIRIGRVVVDQFSQRPEAAL